MITVFGFYLFLHVKHISKKKKVCVFCLFFVWFDFVNL